MLFQNVIKLRDMLAEHAQRNNILATLCTGEDDYNQDSSGQLDNIKLDFNSSQGVLSIVNLTDNESIDYNLVDIPNRLSDYIPGTSITLSDYLQTFSASGDLYSMLGSITSKYAYSNRLSLTNLNQIIDGIGSSGSIDYDVKDLKNHLLSVVDNDGFISVKVWLTTIKAWFQNCENEAQNESPSLDDTKPYALGGLYSLIMNAITSAISNLFQMLTLAFRGILSVIGAVFSVLFKALSEAINISASIDPEAPNLFAKGVAKSFEINTTDPGYSNIFAPILNELQGYEIKFIQYDSIGVFYWRSDVNNTSLRCNAYIQPKASPECLINTLNGCISNGSLELIATAGNTKAIKRVKLMNYDVYTHWNNKMTDEQENLAASDVVYYCACVCASELQRALKNAPKYALNPSTGQTYSDNYFDPNVAQYASSVNTSSKIVAYGARLVVNLHDGLSLYDGINQNDLVDTVNKWAGQLFTEKNQYYPHMEYCMVAGYFPMTIQANPLYCDGIGALNDTGFACEYVQSDDHFSISNAYYVNYGPIDDRYIESNCLPQNFSVTFDAVTSSEWIALMLISGAAAIAGAFVYTKVAKAIRIKKIKKQAIRSGELARAKQAWENDPTNAQLLNDYASQVDKYNRIGRVLGWGTYDAANGWIDSSSSGSTEPKTSPIITAVGSSLGSALSTVSTNIIDDVIPGVSSKSSQESVTQGFNTVNTNTDAIKADTEMIISKLNEILNLIH